MSDTNTGTGRTGRKVVVVTGASAGVGRAVAKRFAKEGFDVGLIARGQAGLDAAADDVRRLGGRAAIYKCDVADAQAVDAAADEFEQTLGPIDVWVNNAMVSVFSPVSKMEAHEYQRVTNVTYLGSVYGTMAALRHMRARNAGAIVQVSSALAYRSIPLQSAYCGAKHAIVGFLDSLRCELAHEGSKVHITAVHMPALNTPQFGWVKSRLPNQAQPVPPIFEPEVAADAVFYASKHKRRGLDVGAPTVAAIVGNKLIPQLIDEYLAKTGFSSQQTDEPHDANAPDNLYDPVDNEKDHGARGSFSDRSTTFSPQLWLAKHRPWVLAVGAAGLIGAGVAAVEAMRSGKR